MSGMGGVSFTKLEKKQLIDEEYRSEDIDKKERYEHFNKFFLRIEDFRDRDFRDQEEIVFSEVANLMKSSRKNPMMRRQRRSRIM